MLWFAFGVAGASPACAEADGAGRVGPVEGALFFDTGKGTLKPESTAAVEALACLLRGGVMPLHIAVHSDAMGSAVYNLRLTQARAESIATALVGLGIDGGRLTAVGYGETLPLTEETTPEAHRANRRIELSTGAGPHPPPPQAPPAADPVPDPVPPPPDPCAAFQRWWRGCAATFASGQACRVGTAPDVAAGQVAQCLGGTAQRDGQVWFVPLEGHTVSLRPVDGGSGAWVTSR